MKTAVVFGGYGTFGALVSTELARLGIRVTIAGRDGARAAAFAATLPNAGAHRGLAADLARPASLDAALDGQAVVVNCAGPFSAGGTALLDAALAAGCHHVDIADDRAYAAAVRARHHAFRAAGRVAAYGCSSLPGLSGALALLLVEERGENPAPLGARVTLFIGNDNPKGGAAVRTAVRLLGKPVSAPQGTLKGFRDRALVPLPAPFGRRAVYTFESPEYDLFPPLLGVSSVEVKVGFELRAATWAFATLARFSSRYGDGTARFLEAVGGIGRGVGCSGGAVMTELFAADGTRRRAALHSTENAQRMAALPCAYVVERLCRGDAVPTGALTAYELLGARPLLDRLLGDGYSLERATG